MGKNTDLSVQDEQVNKRNVTSEYEKLLSGQCFEIDDTHAGLFEKQLSLIKAMAQLSSSGVTVYDHHKRTHIYTSHHFYQLFGYDIKENQTVTDHQIFDRKIHPEDLQPLEKNGYLAMKFLLDLPSTLRGQYKMVNEYRILSVKGNYIRVIEQHQVLELDAAGNIWRSLGVIDISPNQGAPGGVKSQVLNFHTGELIDLPDDSPPVTSLTSREREILEMIGNGKLSKEISFLLSISIHTVNTHRQRILEKLKVDNSIEALFTARHKKMIS